MLPCLTAGAGSKHAVSVAPRGFITLWPWYFSGWLCFQSRGGCWLRLCRGDWFSAEFSVSCASFHSPIKPSFFFFSEDANWVSLEYFITLSSSISSTSLPGPINQSTKQPFSAARHSVPKVSRTLFVTEGCRPGENGAAKRLSLLRKSTSLDLKR